jgi:hypothetical protein
VPATRQHVGNLFNRAMVLASWDGLACGGLTRPVHGELWGRWGGRWAAKDFCEGTVSRILGAT